jgi:outer membrane protein W
MKGEIIMKANHRNTGHEARLKHGADTGLSRSALSELVGIACILLLVGSASSSFAAQKGDMILRLGLQYANPSAQTISESSGRAVFNDPANPPLGTFDFEQRVDSIPNSTITGNLGFEYMISNSFGLDFNISTSTHDITLDYSGDVIWTPLDDPAANEASQIVGGQSGEIRMTPITMGLSYHLGLSEAVNLYFGPLIGVVMYGDAQLQPGEFVIELSEFISHTPLDAGRANVKNDFTYGAALGLDVAFNESWSFSASARYLLTTVEVAGETPEVDLDPLLAQVGLGYRF